MQSIETILLHELTALDGLVSHHPETGRSVAPGGLLAQYTNRLFGAPHQLLDSVDARFSPQPDGTPGINSQVGTEYLRNFLLNSPILHIKPGMPHYTGDGKGDSLLRDIFVMDGGLGQNTFNLIMTSLSKNVLFKKSGSKLQRRMFTFRETYMDYMAHVNYMCRSVAIYLGLEEAGTFVASTTRNPTQSEFVTFSEIRWENYRMFNTYVASVREYSLELISSMGGDVGSIFSGIWSKINPFASVTEPAETIRYTNPDGTPVKDPERPINALSNIAASVNSFTDGLDQNQMQELQRDIQKQYGGTFSPANGSDIIASWEGVSAGSKAYQTVSQKVKSVAFMVEPASFNESMSNQTAPSMLSSAIDGLENGIGSEIAFITNSKADVGAIGELTKFTASTVEGLAERLTKLIEPATGGFMSNLFSGALGALKGQKMIYPDIYKTSSSSMQYEFSVTLSSPYGDNYNYFVNIVVPLLHLIALAAPRMVSANTVASPFLVQAYIPGMVTCQLGIVESMSIVKNPTNKHVSVHGFPLTVKVNFTVKELYNSLSISSARDPASFLYNETLNDYMTNMAGLIPSADTYMKKKTQAFEAISKYFGAEIIDDVVSRAAEGLENFIIGFK